MAGQITGTDAQTLVRKLWRQSQHDTRQGLITETLRHCQQLSNSELVQFYLLDDTKTALYRCGQWFREQVQTDDGYSQPASYSENCLLSRCLISQSSIHLNQDVFNQGQPLDFMPEDSGFYWRSLALVPVLDADRRAAGVILFANGQVKSESRSRVIQKLTGFALLQLALINHKHSAVSSATPVSSLAEQGDTSAQDASRKSWLYDLVGESDAIKHVRQLISRVLHSTATVLISGETGTGKDIVAKALHHSGPRRTQPFIAQSCASLPEHLLESELFGYCKGAFSGADRDYPGLFQAADGGTLFLDEIGDMPIQLQVKLLRVLQDQEVRPLGSTQSRPVNVRIIAATHQNLEQLVKAGKFRCDLYYRLAEFPIELPALRDRACDWQLLAAEFMGAETIDPHYIRMNMTAQTVSVLNHYHFPGNVRELKSMMQRARLIAEPGQLIDIEHLSLARSEHEPEPEVKRHSYELTLPVASGTFSENMEYLEGQLLHKALNAAKGNQSKAAKSLGMKRGAFVYRMKKLNIQPENCANLS